MTLRPRHELAERHSTQPDSDMVAANAQLAKVLEGWAGDDFSGGLRVESPLAAEQLLVPSFMEEAQRRLGTRAVLAAVPRRGLLLAVGYRSETDARRLRRRVERLHALADAPLSKALMVVCDGRIIAKLPAPGERPYAAVQLMGHDLVRRRLVFRHHGGAAPLNELQQVAFAAQTQRLHDGTPVDIVEVVFSSSAHFAEHRAHFERLGAVVSVG